MNRPKNKDNYRRKFKRQITEWVSFDDCWKVAQDFFKYDGKKSYGVTFFIRKCNRMGKLNGLYAVFVKRSKMKQVYL